eukprot:TRINITY_DN4612_c0_g1_i2.p1 TRINITY_DN4612_c0_g1~~TRINITY_DN4612_c0_g1_i2.p1  ORF type:complete len:333 (-),score=108.05 TRINITY_DN4612_c0_g1_i2:200-1198(-)
MHFVCSGSEAIDLATQYARSYTGSFDILALRNSYHGLQGVAMGLTGNHKCRQDFPTDFGVKHVMNPDMLRGPFAHQSEEDAVESYVRDVKDTIMYETSGKIAAFVYEQVQGYGGIHVLPKGYAAGAAEAVREAGGLVIADEVQSGLGRMRTKDDPNIFWSYEMDGVEPDIIVSAKGISNGFPVAFVAIKREIAESITHKSWFNTYGGNPVGAAAICGTFKVLNDETFRQKTLDSASALQQTLTALKDDHDIIGDVRGRGLMYGIEICEPGTKTPSNAIATQLYEDMKNQGIAMGLGGMFGNVLRCMSPMSITPEDVAFFETVFRDCAANPGK